MPRRVADAPVTSDDKKIRIAVNGNKLPDPIREGEILTDSTGTSWRLGRSIGVGGFGEIYLASNDISKNVKSDTEYIVKVEQYSNGPLFVERNFYIRAAKPEMISEWRRQKRLKYLGISQYFGSGSHVYRGERYRFVVLQRFGQDLSKLFQPNKKHFPLKTVYYLGMQILDALEYIHSHGYVHADVKACNLILGHPPGTQRQHVYVVDFGLASKFQEKGGCHKPYHTDNRKANAGTMEYICRDGHVGAYSRRGDLESLGYNLLQWHCGCLPWEDCLPDWESVHDCKKSRMANVPLLMRECFPDTDPPDVLGRYMKYVASLNFDSQPDYAYCKKLLRSGVTEAGFIDDGKLEFDISMIPNWPTGKGKKKSNKRGPAEEPENIAELKPKKIVRFNIVRQPCVAQNLNRMTRNSNSLAITLRSHHFSWEKVLLSNPEKKFRKQSRPVVRADTPPQACTLTAPQPVQQTELILTPAMKSVLRRIQERECAGVTAAPRKSRSDSSRSSSPLLEVSGFGILTYAMEEVLRRREIRGTEDYSSSPDFEHETEDGETSVGMRTRSGFKFCRRRSPSSHEEAVEPRSSTCSFVPALSCLDVILTRTVQMSKKNHKFVCHVKCDCKFCTFIVNTFNCRLYERIIFT